MDKTFDWSSEKNKVLIKERDISFESAIAAIESGNLLEIVKGKGGFGHQQQFIVLIRHYVYVVPFVEDETKVFLKTIIPSRKMTRRYLSGGGGYEVQTR